MISDLIILDQRSNYYEIMEHVVQGFKSEWFNTLAYNGRKLLRLDSLTCVFLISAVQKDRYILIINNDIMIDILPCDRMHKGMVFTIEPMIE